jgi:hypothetical protein
MAEELPSESSKHRELTMNRLTRFAVAVATTALLAAPAVYAAPVNITSPIHAMFGKSKSSTVKFSIRNESGAPMEVKIDDKVVTLDPGKPVNLELPVGTRIIANTATPNHAVGSVIEQVIKEHAGATIVVR